MPEEILILTIVGLVILGGIVLVPLLLIALWSRVGELERKLARLEGQVTQQVRRGLAAAPPTEVPAVPPAPAVVPPSVVPPFPTVGPPTPPPRMPVPSRPRPQSSASADDDEGVWIEEFEPQEDRPPRQPAAAQVAPVRPPRATAPPVPRVSLEELLAGKWLTWLGALAVVIGAGFALKYAVDQQMLGPTGRVVIGLLSGMACLAAGAVSIARNYRFLGEGLLGAALGILYMALFAAAQWYQLISLDVAFFAMILVTAAGLAISTIFSAQSTAILGLIGGFMTPVMLSTGTDAPWVHFPYLLMLDAGVLGIALFRRWQVVSIVALAGTVLFWLGWFERFYLPEKMGLAIGFMTAFFALFALLGVIRSIVRRESLAPLDFVVLLATPVCYFAGLYAVTRSNYSQWHGLMSVALGAIYLGLATLALRRAPAAVASSRPAAALVLGGVAASFLTLAIPLQLTGHWVAIAWTAEAVLLVELGLAFHERKLRLAGFGLLIVVQFLLMGYVAETLDNPAEFSTRFTADRVLLPETPLTTPPSVPLRPEPRWTDMFNGRSFSFLASALALAALAWDYRRRLDAGTLQPREGNLPDGAPDASVVSLVLLGAAPLCALAMFLIETFSFGHLRGWIGLSFTGWFTIWTALAALAIAWLATGARTRPLWWLAGAAYGLLALLVAASLLQTLDRGSVSRYARLPAGGMALEVNSIWFNPVVNPRGVGLLVAIASGISGGLLAWRHPPVRPAGVGTEGMVGDGARSRVSFATALLVFAHLTGLVLVTTEVFAQGTLREWGTGRSLGITLAWSVYAIATVMVGIYQRSSALRLLALTLFVLTSLKVFLYDVWRLNTMIRTFAFIGLGVSLLLVSFLYRRYRHRIREWMAPSLALLALGLTLSPATARAFDGPANLARALSHRMPLVVDGPPTAAGAHLVRLPIPVELYSHARSDLADVRILAGPDAGSLREIPYLVVQPADESKVVEQPVKMLNLSARGEDTEFLLDASGVAEPINSLLIQIDDASRNFERPVSVYGGLKSDTTEWSLLSETGYLLDVSRPGHRMTVSRIELPASRFAWYRVVIHNDGEPPLKISGGRLFDRVERRAPRREFRAERISADHDAQARESRFVFDLGTARVPTGEVQFDVHFEGNFYRTANLSVADETGPAARWRLVGSGQLYSVARPQLQARDTGIRYPETQGRYLRLTVQNGDDVPLDVVAARASARERFLVIDRQKLAQVAGDPVAVYVGNSRLEAPRYDLARTAGPYALETLPALQAQGLEANPLYRSGAPPGTPWSERHQALLWSITLLSVAILGGLTVWVLRQAVRSGVNAPDNDSQSMGGP